MNIQKELQQIISADRIKTRYIDLVSFASDAGFYYLLPKAVVQPINEDEIARLFRFSHQHQVPVVFRTGGTSLSGQAITDGILVDLSQFWNGITILEGGNQVRVQPGITGAMVNTYLKKFGRKIGPDPSSISAAMMGGILSNNASGMCCGVVLNSYHTTQYIRFILPNGKVFSTENKVDYERFEKECSELFTVIAGLHQKVNNDSNLYKLIRRKYQTKNTVGYSLNALIDYEHPLDILAHLLIGGEGTLAFIAEAVMNTVPDYAFKSTALLYFPNIYAACQAIVPLTKAGALMVELMDRASLHAVENMPGIPDIVKTLPETAAALLIEFQENNQAELSERVDRFLASVHELDLFNAPEFTNNPMQQAFYWQVRKGLFPAVGAVRASGTTVILEDVAFPVERLGDAILDLQQLFKQYHYDKAIIFGHAKDGNIHFVVTQAFDTPEEVDRYDRFIRAVVTLVTAKYNGSLKAEHGTGRNMAPFIETEWGGQAYEIMKQIKLAIDPHLLLNPGVIINENEAAHIANLKDLPQVEEEVDRCIECGYCEHKCPSRNITTTPRRRIVVRRALKKLHSENKTAEYKLLLQQYQYDGLDTCAVDGLCATACPVDINTGDLVKRLRRENHSQWDNRMALWVAKNFKTVEKTLRLGLGAGASINSLMGSKAMLRLTAGLKKIIPAMPLWPTSVGSVPRLDVLTHHKGKVGQDAIVYFPACITRIMGTYEGQEKNLMETFMSVCRKANIEVKPLPNVAGSCCSQIFSSKGFKDAYAFTANNIVEKLWPATEEGAFPVVIDVSSCAYTLHQLRPVLSEGNQVKFDKLRILDSVDFLYERVLPKAQQVNKKQSIVLHPVCSLEKMNSNYKLIEVAKRFAENVTVPKNAGCCGMAGDRGFLYPELTASATLPEATEVKAGTYDGYYSSTKTCEIALSQAVEKNYESILYLVDEGME